ncbi:DUF722 domain-containing protein [Weissella paramesenteroides]|uniref:DUF722 domain-containing protein n=1 Tax=Weissella paramesenteroides TaxID=1249 RepID=UPI00123ABDF7|nr:DUF722 domain-containing protein [Weissella paramesenteroides]KAA8457505.1 DUF722 domain-containing protein [Weissella paramesenteroides]KAA8458968.1 DUF722 domain-containing protein [Weissella paramesenteroides]KAA8460643.1 DUF722 domain-containing protein [Weissella paramesenteroides]KAA8460813.1 DUF722 domain-containing protein [Weissella paramesenteroides]KAA8462566.1 DUF722 domain-containing protein [Weissella paramesenteroides]
MADVLDKVLSDYFTGRLEANIKSRKMEIQYNVNRTPDENIGGGRKQNDYNNPIELRMIKEQQDEQLQNWILQKNIIDVFYPTAVDYQQRVLKARYGLHESWIDIALAEHVEIRTVIRWRDDFKDGILGHLLSTLKPMSFLGHVIDKKVAEKGA